jgi:hypothetical protein
MLLEESREVIVFDVSVATKNWRTGMTMTNLGKNI